MNAYSITEQIITPISNNIGGSSAKAELAELRKSISRNELSSEAMRLLVEKMPKEYLSSNGRLSNLEQAVLTAIQIYAIHQQGNTTSVDTDKNDIKSDLKHIEIESDNRGYIVHSWLNNHGETRKFSNFTEVSNYLERWNNEEITTSKRKYMNFGSSLGLLRASLRDTVSLDRRFNSLITSDTYERFTNLLRQLVKLLKSKANYKVDYGQLAEDLYSFLNSKKGKEQIKLNWSTSYYLSRNGEINND